MSPLACGHESTPGMAFYPSPSAPEVCRSCWLDGVSPPTTARVVVTAGDPLGFPVGELLPAMRAPVDDFGELLDEAA